MTKATPPTTQPDAIPRPRADSPPATPAPEPPPALPVPPGQLIDEFTPTVDVGLMEHLVVNAPPDVTYEKVGELRFTDIRTPLVRAMLVARGLPRLVRWVRRGGVRGWRHHHAVPIEFTLDDLVMGTTWVLLGEHPGSEIVLGAAGRFWTPIIRWQDVAADGFADYERPGSGTIAASFSVHPYGAGKTLLTHEVRVRLTDPFSRRVCGWYWFVVRPFAHLLARGMLHAIRREAEREAGRAGRTGN